jgi:hypothetical protein
MSRGRQTYGSLQPGHSLLVRIYLLLQDADAAAPRKLRPN